MAAINADNKEPQPAASGSDQEAPSESLEKRIDSLLSEMQESLDELDVPDEDSADEPEASVEDAPEASAEEDREAEVTAEADETLAEALDEAVAQATDVLEESPPEEAGAEATPEGADAIPDPDFATEPEEPASPDTADATSDTDSEQAVQNMERSPEFSEKPAASRTDAAHVLKSDSVETPAEAAAPAPDVESTGAPAESIEALDEQLRKAESLPEESVVSEPPAISERGAPMSATDAPADGIVIPGGPEEEPAPGIIDRGVDPEAEPDAETEGAKPKPKIPAIKRKSEPPAPAKPSKATRPDSTAPAEAQQSQATDASVTPKAESSKRDQAQRVSHRTLETLSAPLMFVPPHLRDYIGWFGLLTAFNAVCVWLFWILLRN